MVSSYFNHIDNQQEQKLFNQLAIENIQLSGVDCYYMPREVLEFDSILGEPKGTSFNESYIIEVYVDQPQGSSGAGDILTKLGVDTQESFTITMSKTRFNDLKIENREYPQPGDIIYFGIPNRNGGTSTYQNSLFEITYVDNENPFWQLGTHFTWKLTVQEFVYSYEQFNTGNEVFDVYNPNDQNNAELDKFINNNLDDITPDLIDTSEKNPFGDL